MEKYFVNREKFLEIKNIDHSIMDFKSDFTMITDETLEFNLKDLKKFIDIRANISSEKLILTDGYFLRNEIHRFRNKGYIGDVNSAYYTLRKELLRDGYIDEDVRLKNRNLSKFTNDKASITVFKIIKPIEFEFCEIVKASSTIYGNWLTLEQCLNLWKRNGLKLKTYIKFTNK